MTAKTGRKATTAADIAAAVALGAMAPDDIVHTDVADTDTEGSAPIAEHVTAPTLPATEHQCGIAGCRHGAGHSGTHQPDRQVKLQCPKCGAVARMTTGALARAAVAAPNGGNGYPTCADGAEFAPAARRQYNRKGN